MATGFWSTISGGHKGTSAAGLQECVCRHKQCPGSTFIIVDYYYVLVYTGLLDYIIDACITYMFNELHIILPPRRAKVVSISLCIDALVIPYIQANVKTKDPRAQG